MRQMSIKHATRVMAEHAQPSQDSMYRPRAVFLGDHVSTEIMIHGIYDGQTLESLARDLFLPNPLNKSTAIDIGANIGNHTLFFARYFKRVIAFEPNPKVAAVLRVNTADLGERIQVMDVGLSDSSGERGFAVNYGNLGGSGIVEAEGEGEDTISVKKLDDFVDDLDLDGTSFIKIDVEGNEEKVLAGASRLLSAIRPNLALEIHSRRGRFCVMDLLKDLGYTSFYRYRHHKTFLKRVIPKPLRTRSHYPLRLEPVERLSSEGLHTIIATDKPIK